MLDCWGAVRVLSRGRKQKVSNLCSQEAAASGSTMVDPSLAGWP